MSDTPKAVSAPNQNQKEERRFDKPVAWLVGRDLLGGLKGILLYTAYGTKLDPRDWMTGQVVPLDQLPAGKEEFWFDFLADAGDGTKAMYSIAYLTMSDLWANETQEIAFTDASGRVPLPRGEFLIIGGDTAYHVADYLTLANRIQVPFRYAFEDLAEHGQIDQRPVFGIPGNHDYYDQLDGFRRQFRKPTRPEPPQPPANPGGEHAALGLAGFLRAQEASYFALKLPFEWWLWALDTETGPLDGRQEKFFTSLAETFPDGEFFENQNGKTVPKKLVMVTSAPSTVFGKVADPENDFKATQAMQCLFGPEQPFLPPRKTDCSHDFDKSGDSQIQTGQCRLDVAGDVHHYARYWGPEAQPADPVRKHSKAPRPSARSYASIVTGLGGAFHHPSNTYDDEIQEQVLYPTEKASRAAVGKQVFNFLSIWDGGYVFLFGFIIAFVIYFAASVTQSSRQFLANVAPTVWDKLDLFEPEPIMPTTERRFATEPNAPATEQPPQAASITPNAQRTEPPKPCKPVYPFPVWKWLGLAKQWDPPPNCNQENPHYFMTSTGAWPRDLIIGQVLIFVSLGVTVMTFVFSNRIFGSKEDPKKRLNPNKKLWLIVPPTAAAIFLGMVTVERYHDHITPFVSSLMVLFTLIIAAGAIMLTVRYNGYLFQKGHYEYVKKWDRFWPWLLPVLSVLGIAAGLWTFGRNNLPALLVTDIVFSLVFVATFIALVFLPVAAGGELFYTVASRPLGFIGKILIGTWHAVLQLLVPFVLIRRGNLLTWIVAAVLMLLPMWLAARLYRNNSRVALGALWLIYGAVMIALPWLTSASAGFWPFASPPLFGASWFGSWGLIPSFVAGLAGAGMSCLWFGWYLGICSIFNGHNNEVGGAARIEEFKQFIRFKVTDKELTAYVIAVDDVSIINEPDGQGRVRDGRDLKPKLIEAFTLKVK